MRTRERLGLGLLWAAVVAAGFAALHPLGRLPFFPHGAGEPEPAVLLGAWGGHAAALAAAGTWLLILAAWGGPALRWLAAGTPAFRGPHASLGIGFGLAGGGIMALGFTGLLFPAVLAGFGAGPALAFRLWRPAGRGVAGLGRRLREGRWWIPALAAPVLMALPGMLSPEGSWDALVYHLSLPSFYLLEHKFFVPEVSPFAGYPALAEMHYLLALSLTGADHLPKLMHGTCWLLTAWLIWEVARPFGRVAAGGTALLWLLSPLGIHLAGMAYVDHAAAWMAALAAAFLGGRGHRGESRQPAASRARDSGRGTPDSGLVLAGVFAGFAFLVKYTAAFAGVGLAACLVLGVGRGRRGAAAALAVAAAAVPASVWLVRNWLGLGNPAYPFFPEVLGGVVSPALEFWRAHPPGGSGEGVLALVLRPWSAAVTDDGGVGAPLGPLWIALFVPAAVAGRLDARRWPFFAAGALAWWLSPLDGRFFLPLVPAALLAALPAWREREGTLPALASVIVLAPLCLKAAASASWGQYDCLAPALGLRSHARHLEYGLPPQPEYWESAGRINAELPRRARLLFASGIKSYYIDRRATVAHWDINPVPVMHELKRAGSAERLAIRLRQRGLTHFVYMPRAMRIVPTVPGSAMREPEAGEYVRWLRGWTTFAFRVREVLVYALGPRRHPRDLGRVPVLEEFALKEATEEGPSAASALLARLAPESSSLGVARGVRTLLSRPEAPEAALSALSRMERDPEAPAVGWRALGFASYRTGSFDRALAAFRKSVELDPSDAETRYNTGELLVEMGRIQAALGEFLRALALDPGNPKYRAAAARLSRASLEETAARAVR